MNDIGKMHASSASSSVLNVRERYGLKARSGCSPERSVARRRRDGRSAVRQIWRGMWSRCTNPGENRYHRYGGRGIRVCERWHSFEAFVQDMGERPTPEHSIDRIDNDGNYEPGNCRWATRSEQQRNTCRTTRFRLGGQEKTIYEWSADLGIRPGLLRARVKKHGSLTAALQWIVDNCFAPERVVSQLRRPLP